MWYSTGAPPLPSKRSAKWTHFASSCFLSPWRLSGQYWANSCPMAAFSGFYESPGPPSPSSGNAVSHHRTTIAIKMASNGGTSFVVAASFVWSNIAKWPCYGPFKLALSYYIYLIGVIICLCVSLLAAAADNGRHFGHHSCRRECPISINHRGQ